jgi:N-acyl-D-aspartate/D-glutamate deacylase
VRPRPFGGILTASRLSIWAELARKHSFLNREEEIVHQIIIRNGFVVDGTGAPGSVGDVAVDNDLITDVSAHIEQSGEREIDATGKVVIPGFIDPHVHEEWVCFLDGDYELFLRQGVTTIANGNCGHFMVPGPRENFLEYYWRNGLISTRQRDEYLHTFPNWEDFAGYAQAVDQVGTNVNFVTLLGHGTIRWSVMGGAFDRPPSPEEAQRIENIIRRSMEQGAWGISFGLDYVPSRYASLDELVAVGRIIKDYDGIAAAHLRHALGVLGATLEFLEVGRRSGVKVQISHLKPICPEAFEAVEDAIGAGVEARIDTIPRSTGHIHSKDRLLLFAMALSDELFAGGLDGVKHALHTKEGRKLIQQDQTLFGGDKSDVFVILSEDPHLEGHSVKDIAAERGQDPNECLLDLLADEKKYSFWLGGPSRSDFPDAPHAASILQNPYVCVGTDEIMGDPEDPYDWYELQRRGGFPVFMQMYRSLGVPTEEIVRRNTSMIAQHFGIERRGQLKEGYFADITVLDLDSFRFPSPQEADYRQPLTMAEGVEYVLVNGQLALDARQVQHSRSGRVLRRP